MTALPVLLAAALAAASPPSPLSCRQEAGAAQADRMVRACRDVSPATRPPCNAANRCELILGEILRSCAMWKPTDSPPKPAVCADYEPPRPR